jgi:flagellar basal body-associated protein FliL
MKTSEKEVLLLYTFNMPKKNNSIGSAHIIIISIVVVALMGVVGFLGWNALQSKDNASTASTTSETQKEEESETPTTTTPTTSTESNVIKLDSWGVKFMLVESLTSTQAKYYARTTADTPPQEYYGFSTARVEALGGNCSTLPLSDIVILQRYAEKPVAVPDGELISESPIGGHYYVVTGPIASCDPNSSVVSQDRAALKDSLKSLQVIN